MPLNPTTSRERITVLADANVVYSNDQRNILMTFGVEGVIRLRWTNEIKAEWVKNLVRKESENSAITIGYNEKPAERSSAVQSGIRAGCYPTPAIRPCHGLSTPE